MSKINKAAIFDLDGTLCDDSHRQHFAEKDQWQEYHSRCIDDRPFNFVCDIMMRFYHDYHILLLTGRDEQYRSLTNEWISKNNLFYDRLYMRPNGNHSPSAQLKKEIYETEIEPNFDIVCVFEDRSRVVKMWRELGLMCLQTKEGNY